MHYTKVIFILEIGLLCKVNRGREVWKGEVAECAISTSSPNAPRIHRLERDFSPLSHIQAVQSTDRDSSSTMSSWNVVQEQSTVH